MAQDPVYARWKRQYPKFPGVAKCVALLRRHNTHGSLVDIICGELQDNAAEHIDELITAFQTEPEERIRHILLGLLAEVRLTAALPIFVENLGSPDETLQYWAVEGLRLLDTPEARKALWQIGKAK